MDDSRVTLEGGNKIEKKNCVLVHYDFCCTNNFNRMHEKWYWAGRRRSGFGTDK